jgi:hypothetical protein
LAELNAAWTVETRESQSDERMVSLSVVTMALMMAVQKDVMLIAMLVFRSADRLEVPMVVKTVRKSVGLLAKPMEE